MNSIIKIVRWFTIRLMIIALVAIVAIVALTVYVDNVDTLTIPLNDNVVFVCGQETIDYFFWNIVTHGTPDNVTVRDIGSNCVILTGIEVTLTPSGMNVQL